MLSPYTFKVERVWGYRSPWLLAHGEPVLGGGKTPKVFGVVVRGVEGLIFWIFAFPCYGGGPKGPYKAPHGARSPPGPWPTLPDRPLEGSLPRSLILQDSLSSLPPRGNPVFS